MGVGDVDGVQGCGWSGGELVCRCDERRCGWVDDVWDVVRREQRMCIVCSEHDERRGAEYDSDWGRVRDAEVRMLVAGMLRSKCHVDLLCWIVSWSLGVCGL